MAKITVPGRPEIAKALGIETEAGLIDWQSRDGKMITAAETLARTLGPLSKEDRRKALEQVEQQLGHKIEEAETDLTETRIERAALRAVIPDKTFDDRYAEIIEKYMPPQIGIPDPSRPAPDTPLSQRCARSLAEVREQATAMWAKHKPGEEERFSHRWYRLGFPTFDVTGGLAAALCMTDCRGILGRDFRTPFAALAVQMPSPSPLTLPKLGDVRFMLLDGRNDVMVYGSGDVEALSGPLPAIADGDSIDAWLRALDVPKLHEGWPQVVRFIVNLCVYIDSLHALPPPEGKKKPHASAKKRDHEPAPPQRWVLGREIKLSAGMMQAARAVVSGNGTAKQRAAYRMHVRFMVRGHWRNQACGKKHAERKLRWIEPFWKGPEMADGLARLYAVASEETPKP